MKKFTVTQDVGLAKYVISYHDGEKKHPDGSAFYDIKISNNKRKLDRFTKQLKKDGYVPR